LSKSGSFARFLNSVEKFMHQRPNPIPFLFQREMPRVEKMEFCTGNISLKEFRTLHRKDPVVFAPSDQRGGLLFAEILLPIGKDIQIPFCVGRAVRMDGYKVLAVCSVRRGKLNLLRPVGFADPAFTRELFEI
jgi:hypothetical protein